MRGVRTALLVIFAAGFVACTDHELDDTGSGGSTASGGTASGGAGGGGASGGSGGGASGSGGTSDAGPDSGLQLTCDDLAVTTLAGAEAGFAEGSAGPNGIARLNGVRGIAAFGTVLALVADMNNHRIRNLLFDAGDCEVFAGSGTAGLFDAEGEQAELRAPEGVAVDAVGTLYISDTQNHAIRRVQSAMVSTLAGDGKPGFADGPAPRFREPAGLAVDAQGNVFVADRGNHAVRKLTAGAGAVTLAGNGVAGFQDGPGTSARFSAPFGVAIDAAGVLWVSDTGNDRIRKVDPTGNVTTFVGGDGSLDAPMGIAVDAYGTVYVADAGHGRVVRVSPSGVLETLAGAAGTGFFDGPTNSAKFSELTGLALSSAYAGGGLLVGDAHRVRLVYCP
ncbi:MAG: hypothetical protein IPI67_04140 [Myxococcales bacterium]|nr:hypothetical protein [Myxococcales bacterium]